MPRNKKVNIPQLVLPIWNSESGCLPVLDSQFTRKSELSTNTEVNIFKQNEMHWMGIIGEKVAKTQENLQQLYKESDLYIETCYENMLTTMEDILNKDKPVTEIPKTPHTKRKPKSRVKRLTRVTNNEVINGNIRRSMRNKSNVLADNLEEIGQLTSVSNKNGKNKRTTFKEMESFASPATDQQQSGAARIDLEDSPKVQTLIEYHEKKITEANLFSPDFLDTRDVSDVEASTHPQAVEDSLNAEAKNNSEIKEDIQSTNNLSLLKPKTKRTSNARRSILKSLSAKKPKPKEKPKANKKKLSKILRDSAENFDYHNMLDKALRNSGGQKECSQLQSMKDNIPIIEIDELHSKPVNEPMLYEETSLQNSVSMDTSSSVCSSSAATIDMDDANNFLAATPKDKNLSSSILLVFPESDEDEEFGELENGSTAKANATVSSSLKEGNHVRKSMHRNVRRSTRASTRVLGGLAAKRLSTRQSMRRRTETADQIVEQVNENTTEDDASSQTEESEREEDDVDVDDMKKHSPENESRSEQRRIARPKIAKPVVRPKPRKHHPPVARSAGAQKRCRAVLTHNSSINAGNRSLVKTPSPPKHKKLSADWASTPSGVASITRSKKLKTSSKKPVSFLNRSTAASRAKVTPGRSTPSQPRLFPLIPRTPTSSNINNTVKSFLLRNTPDKISREDELEAKKQAMEDRSRKEEERQKKIEEEKQAKLLEQKRKREERAKRANHLREMREKADREKQDKIQDRWMQKIAEADRTKTLRREEESARVQRQKEKLEKAEARRKEEEAEKITRFKEQEEEREKRLRQLYYEKKQHEEHKLKERRIEEEKREEQKRQEEENIRLQKLEEEQKAAREEERLRKKREHDEQERARRKKEVEAAADIASKKRKQEEMTRLKEQREEARKEREAARQLRMEEKRLEKEAEKRKKEEQKRLREEQRRAREEEKRQREESLRQQQEEEEKAREREAAMRNEEEMLRLREEKERQKAEEEAKRQAVKKKKDLMRKKIEAERKVLEEEKKQKRIRDEQERLRILREEREYDRKMKEAKQKLAELEAQKQQINGTFTVQTPKSQHNATASQNDASMTNYNMTPRGPDRPLLPSTSTDYNIQDMRSDDSTDNEDEPKKQVPKWAKGGALSSALIQQHCNNLSLVDRIFSGLLGEVNLAVIFPSKSRERYFKRTSSAHWNSPIMPPGHTSFTSQCKGF